MLPLQTVSIALAAFLSVASSASVGSPLKPVPPPESLPIDPHHPRSIPEPKHNIPPPPESDAPHHPRYLPPPPPPGPHGVDPHHGPGPRSTGDVLSCVAVAVDGLKSAPAYDGCHDLCAHLLNLNIDADVDANVNVAGLVSVDASVSLSLGPHNSKFWKGTECALTVTNPDCDNKVALTLDKIAPYCLSALSCVQAGLDAHLDVEALGINLVLGADVKVGDLDVCAA